MGSEMKMGCVATSGWGYKHGTQLGSSAAPKAVDAPLPTEAAHPRHPTPREKHLGDASRTTPTHPSRRALAHAATYRLRRAAGAARPVARGRMVCVCVMGERLYVIGLLLDSC